MTSARILSLARRIGSSAYDMILGMGLAMKLRFQELEESEVLRRFGRLRTRMAEASADFSEDEVAREVAAARAELGT